MAASQLSHRGEKNEGESAAEAYYFSVEAAETLMNPDRSRSPTQPYMHASAHTIYAAPLTALPLFPLLSSFSGLHMHSHAHRRHFQMSYLHHCGGWSLVRAFNASHLAKAADRGRRTGPMEMTQGVKSVFSTQEQSEPFNRKHFI